MRLDPNIELRSSRGVVALAARGVASGVVDAFTLGDFAHADIDWRPLDPRLPIESRIVQLAGRTLARSEDRAIDALVGDAIALEGCASNTLTLPHARPPVHPGLIVQA